jgi:ComF family protein
VHDSKMTLVLAKRASYRIASLLLPGGCAFCGLAADGETVCQGCLGDLPWIIHSCDRCGTPLATSLSPGVLCGSCQQRLPPFSTTIAPLHYDFPVDAAIKALKFERKLFFAPALASLLLPRLKAQIDLFDALVPVPLYRWRRSMRGYNQAHELAKHLRAATGLPISRCVVRTKKTIPQSGLDAVSRRRNMQNVFQLKSAPCCMRPLIIDDVMTTGETCRSLASTLLAGGVERVGVATVAHASF